MNEELSITMIGAVSALLGALIGGALSYFSTKSINTKEWVRSIAREEIQDRRHLYSSFLEEISRLEMKSHKEKTGDISEFDKVANFIAQIELFGTEETLSAAGKLADHALTSHAANSQATSSYPELRKKFVKAVRGEIESLKVT
ncbi:MULTISPECIES: hypothetical protein [Pseudomonadota]|uniref:hypothetical protein n=2 Tax=Pseudomonadota TaxID=1224 RepID=UPI002942934B|nr:hypothetical protein [Marinobacter salarius]WOI18334.1 hypothetical protein R1T46_16350 [Marinobacter salarius]